MEKRSIHEEKCNHYKKVQKETVHRKPLQSNFIDGHGDTDMITHNFAEQLYSRTWLQSQSHLKEAKGPEGHTAAKHIPYSKAHKALQRSPIYSN